jgi:hypothetical protein
MAAGRRLGVVDDRVAVHASPRGQLERDRSRRHAHLQQVVGAETREPRLQEHLEAAAEVEVLGVEAADAHSRAIACASDS